MIPLILITAISILAAEWLIKCVSIKLQCNCYLKKSQWAIDNRSFFDETNYFAIKLWKLWIKSSSELSCNDQKVYNWYK